jgi:FkbH-like protein
MSEEVLPGKPVKLVVWNLDDPRWSAPLIEGEICTLIETLDDRGILQSVVTRRASEPARAMLQRLELAAYFLAPQLGTQTPGAAVAEIAQRLNLALDATLVIGDDPDDPGAIPRAHPQVRAVACAAPDGYARLADDPRMGHSLAGLEPRPRRLVYLEEQARAEAERSFAGSKQAFVASLGMQLTLALATAADLHRVRELVTRTNQLGVSYGDDELAQLLRSPDHLCWLVSLADRFGDCGQVGLVVVERGARRWTLQLFQFSCRVLPRGVDTIVLDELVRRAQAADVPLVVQARPTRKNEAMLAAYHRAGFAPCDAHDDVILLARVAAELPPVPPGVRVTFTRASQPSA